MEDYMTESNILNAIGWNLDSSYSKLPNKLFSVVNPTPVRSPKLVILNHSLAKELGLNSKELESDEGIQVFAGNKIAENSKPIAQAYAGHQFGYFNMLGDGRAILLGEQITTDGRRMDIQLKGSGRTPYSRGGDGRAALGPMLREYIISEAMYALGIPTTRSLAVVTTGEPVYRESELPGAILTRVASSHIRVATFQFAARLGSKEILQSLSDYTINRHYPNCIKTTNPYITFLNEVIKRQAELIAKWQLVGFIHGVMNTDNMSISGETIDYGPCAFMDTYDPKTVFSSIDTRGRYAYGNQPPIAKWNLDRFADTLLPLLHDDQETAIKIAEDATNQFNKLYQIKWLEGMRSKLGIFDGDTYDQSLIEEILTIMYTYKADYTNTFLALSYDKYTDSPLFESSDYLKWYEKWQARVQRQQKSKEDIKNLMLKSNPAVIPRNHRVEEALDAAVNQGDFKVMKKLLSVLSNPYSHSLEQAEYAKLPEKINCSYRTFCGT
jgi:serine/tyrosine/threonine adenylyltransferase